MGGLGCRHRALRLRCEAARLQSYQRRASHKIHRPFCPSSRLPWWVHARSPRCTRPGAVPPARQEAAEKSSGSRNERCVQKLMPTEENSAAKSLAAMIRLQRRAGSRRGPVSSPGHVPVSFRHVPRQRAQVSKLHASCKSTTCVKTARPCPAPPLARCRSWARRCARKARRWGAGQRCSCTCAGMQLIAQRGGALPCQQRTLSAVPLQ